MHLLFIYLRIIICVALCTEMSFFQILFCLFVHHFVRDLCKCSICIQNYSVFNPINIYQHMGLIATNGICVFVVVWDDSCFLIKLDRLKLSCLNSICKPFCLNNDLHISQIDRKRKNEKHAIHTPIEISCYLIQTELRVSRDMDLLLFKTFFSSFLHYFNDNKYNKRLILALQVPLLKVLFTMV